MKIAMSSFVSEVKVYAGEDSWEVIGGRLIGKVKNLEYKYTITREEIKKNLDKSYKQLRETFKNHGNLSKIIEPRDCEICQTTFTPEYPHAFLCSDKCRGERARNRAGSKTRYEKKGYFHRVNNKESKNG
jgi:hypothetical protein